MIQRLSIIGCIALSLSFITATLSAAEVMPPKPARYFNDAASVVSREVGDRLNEQLAQYERDSSNQLVVAVYPKMQTDSSLEDYATRIFQSWGVGQKGRNNGAVLFVFIQDRKMRIQTGYGLEASLTDAESFRIIEGMKPWLRSGDHAGGLSFAVNAMITATKGEYQGTGKTVKESSQRGWETNATVIFFATIISLLVITFIIKLRRLKEGYVYERHGRLTLPGESTWYTILANGGGGSWGGNGGGFSGGFSSGGGSGFSGGGGSTGGGGASGSW